MSKREQHRSRIATRAKGAGAALAIALTAAACGSSARPTAQPSSRSRSTTPGLTSLLVSHGGEPGFTLTPPQMMTSVHEWVSFAGGSPAQAASATRRYEVELFRAAALEQTAGSGGAQGVSNVIEFATAAGAQKEMANLLDPPGVSARFPVAGIPTADGLTEGSAQNGSAANVVWVQGRCILLVGDFRPTGTAPRQPLIKAAKAVYDRTHGTCP